MCRFFFIFALKVPHFFSATCTWQCKDSLFEVDCSDSRASFFFFCSFFCLFFFYLFFLSTNAWHSKWQDVSTTCTICSNEVEMVIKRKKPDYKTTSGWNQKQFSTKCNYRNTDRSDWVGVTVRLDVLIIGSAQVCVCWPFHHITPTMND